MKGVNLFTGELVEDVVFFTSTIRPAWSSSENQSELSAVEKGYIPPEVQIQDMMKAGIALQQARKARFDSVELGVDPDSDIPLDSTRNPGVDLVDIQREADAVGKRLEAAAGKAASEAAAKAKADSEAADAARIEARARELVAAQEKIRQGG